MRDRPALIAALLVGVATGVGAYLISRRLNELDERLAVEDFPRLVNDIHSRLSQLPGGKD